MDDLHRLLQRIPQVTERLRELEFRTPETAIIIFGAILAFGLLNCFLGYRLLRFWMMLAGFCMGAVSAFLILRYMLDVTADHRSVYFASVLGGGILVAAVSFFFYRAGVFILVAGLVMVLSVYFIQPNSSLTFFLCLLLGVLTGVITLKLDRVVIIVVTSLFGGAAAGYALSRLIGVSEMTYGLLISAGLTALGMLVQFAVNRQSAGVSESEALPADEEAVSETGRDKKAGDGAAAESKKEMMARMREEEQANEEFYEEYFHGGDVFDRTSAEVRRLTGESGADDEEDIHLLAWNQKKSRGRKGTERSYNSQRSMKGDSAT